MGIIPNLMPGTFKAEVTRLTFLQLGEAMSSPARGSLPRDATDGLLSTGTAWGVWLLYLVVVAVVPLLVVTRRDTN
jgi:hypothetical protein